jgi:hypothetical protein
MALKTKHEVRFQWQGGYKQLDTVEVIQVFAHDALTAVALAARQSRYFEGRHDLVSVTTGGPQ